MGCCVSLFQSKINEEQDQTTNEEQDQTTESTLNHNHPSPSSLHHPSPSVPSFSEFSLFDIELATNNFNSDNLISDKEEKFINLISDKEEKFINLVYKGRLQNHSWIAVKKFNMMAWPDPEQFIEEALGLGKLRHKRLANLIGYCCDGDERLLVAEYMPNDNLAKRLFGLKSQTIEWAMRLRVAFSIAEALDYISSEGRQLYPDLNTSRVLFDEDGEPRLSSFGLMKRCMAGKSYSKNLLYTPPEYLRNETFAPESIIYSFGTILMDLLSGKHVPPNHALDMIRDGNIILLLDSHLEENSLTEEATVVFDLAYRCLQCEPTERPSTKDLVGTLASLLMKPDVPSYVKLGISKPEEAPPTRQVPLSPMGEACSQMDFTTIHQILVMTDYKDDEGATKLSSQELALQMEDVTESRKRGDIAFGDKDFQTANDCYSEFIGVRSMVSPTILARRSLCNLLCDKPDNALRDAMQAECVYPEWPTAFYMQSVALVKLDMHTDAFDMLYRAAELEEKKKQTCGECSQS